MPVKIVMVVGLPGSGKSFLAFRLSKKMEAEYLNSDLVRKELFLVRTYSEEEKLKVYEVMRSRMEKFVRDGRNVVLDATFYKESIRRRFLNSVEDLKSDCYVIEVVASDYVVKNRLSESRIESEADWSVYQTLKKEFEPIIEKHLTLNSNNENIDFLIHQSLEFIHA